MSNSAIPSGKDVLFGDAPSAVALVSAVAFGLAFFGALVLVTSVRSRHLEERGRQALPNGPDGLGAS